MKNVPHWKYLGTLLGTFQKFLTVNFSSSERPQKVGKIEYSDKLYVRNEKVILLTAKNPSSAKRSN